MSIVIGLGTGRCGTQTFAKMFDIPHQKNSADEVERGHIISDVAPWYLHMIDTIESHSMNFATVDDDIRFVCLKRDREKTVDSFVKNGILARKEAEDYYDSYYARAEQYVEKPNFRIFNTEELNTPEIFEAFLGMRTKDVKPVKDICQHCSMLKNKA